MTWLRSVERTAIDHPWHVLMASTASGFALADARTAVATLGAVAIAAALAALRCGPLAAIAGAACVCATAAGALRLDAIDAPGQRIAPGDRIEERAVLLAPPSPGQFGPSAELEIVSGPARGARVVARFGPGARLPDDTGVELRVSGSARRPSARTASGFALADHLRRRGIASELDVREVRATGQRRGGLAGVFDGIRRRAERGLASGLDPPQAALARGMVLGQDERIDDRVRDDYRASGLGHVLAVSGQNVMLLAALALAVMMALGVGRDGRIAATIVLIAVYVPVAGAGPSLQRAGVMGVAGLVALAASRPASRWYALALAAMVTLALNPRCWADPGWQLSFAAVGGLLLLGGPLRSALSGLPRPLAEGASATLAATVATAPLAAMHFGTVSLASLPANVASLALVAPIMWLGMARAALAQVDVPVAGEVLGMALEPLLRSLSAIAATFAQMRGAELSVAIGSPVVLGVVYAALTIGCWTVGRGARRLDVRRDALAARVRRLPRGRRVALIAVPAIVCALAGWRLLAAPAPPQQLTVSFLDVGQGDATLIQHPDGTAVLFDGGPPEARVTRLLRKAGVRRLAMVVMTHQSRDHQGGLLDVVREYPTDVLVDGGDGTRDPDFRAVLAAARERGVRRVRAIAPMTLRAGGLDVRVVSPPPRPPGPPPEDPNPRAIVAIVSSGGFDLMLSGDAESDTLGGLDLPDVEAIKVPHHGSADPGLPEVLEELRPEIAGIEVGAQNTYGHPTPQTLSALQSAGVRTYRTDRDGTIQLRVSGGRMDVETDR